MGKRNTHVLLLGAPAACNCARVSWRCSCATGRLSTRMDFKIDQRVERLHDRGISVIRYVAK